MQELSLDLVDRF